MTQREGYRPGSFVQASAALNYTHWRNITPQLQLSVRKVWRDGGTDADRPDSGGEQVESCSRNFSAKLTTKIVGFTYLALPLYTRVNGYQLVPKATFSAGFLVHI